MNTLKKIVPIFIAFSLMALILFAQNALFVNSATGNVGVGTDDPESNLHVVGSSGDVAIIEATDSAFSANLVIKNDTTSWTIQVSGSNLRILDNNDTTRVTISSTGNVTLVNNLTANALTATNATISGAVTVNSVTANRITPTTVSGNVNFTGIITRTRGMGAGGYYHKCNVTRDQLYDVLNSEMPASGRMIVTGFYHWIDDHGDDSYEGGGTILYAERSGSNIRLYYDYWYGNPAYVTGTNGSSLLIGSNSNANINTLTIVW